MTILAPLMQCITLMGEVDQTVYRGNLIKGWTGLLTSGMVQATALESEASTVGQCCRYMSCPALGMT